MRIFLTIMTLVFLGQSLFTVADRHAVHQTPDTIAHYHAADHDGFLSGTAEGSLFGQADGSLFGTADGSSPDPDAGCHHHCCHCHCPSGKIFAQVSTFTFTTDRKHYPVTGVLAHHAGYLSPLLRPPSLQV